MMRTAPARGCGASTCTSASLQQRPSRAFSGRGVQSRNLRLARRQPSARGMQTIVSVLDITSENFEQEVVQSELPVLLDFWAHWCGPCKLVLPSVEWAERKYASQLKVVKVEADSNKDLVEKFKVYGLPTIILTKGGEKLAGTHHEGAITQAKLREYLERHGFSEDE